MKHEDMAHAMSQLDDALIAEALVHQPRKRRYFPRMLAAAACLALIVTATLLTRQAPQADLLIGGTPLAGAPIPIEQPAAMTLTPMRAAQPLSIPLSVESRADSSVEVSVSDGVLDSPLDSFPRALSCRTVRGGEALTWTIERPDEGSVYTIRLNGKPSAVLRYDSANGYWAAEKP